MATMHDGAQVEVGTVGFEGMSTTDLILAKEIAIEANLCQIPGTALRMPAEVFRQLTAGDTALRRVAFRYLQAYLSMVSQNVACNRLHIIEHRLAKWLLMSRDRMRRQDFSLTQEYLAAMLGDSARASHWQPARCSVPGSSNTNEARSACWIDKRWKRRPVSATPFFKITFSASWGAPPEEWQIGFPAFEFVG